MGTRACFTFIDADNAIAVYSHYDGYPEGAATKIEDALKYAWELPRFEADDFAAAFVAGNKGEGGGGIRLMSDPAPDMFPADIEYRYEITASKTSLVIKAFAVTTPGEDEKQIFYGPFTKFKIFVEKEAA